MTRGVAKNLENLRFGHLVVTSRTDSDKHGNARWLCKCDCGNEAKIRAAFLLKRQVVCSRNCVLNPGNQIKDISGQVFGELTAIDLASRHESGKSIWNFRCSCGQVVTVPSDRVLNSGMKSCGKGVHFSMYRHGMAGTRGYQSMHYMKYAASKRSQTPNWLTQSQIDEMTAIYATAHRMTKETGIRHEVDHFYPLQGKKVSGLHVPGNLKIVTRTENRRKVNKHPDDVC